MAAPRPAPTPPSEALFDVIVVGGGINGAGVARDAALRGLRVALFERHDFGFGASGNSTGFIHGGPRYLLSDPHVTRDSCVDSGHIQALAPHLVFRVPVLLPIERARGWWSLLLHDAFFRAYDAFQPLKRGKAHTCLTRAELAALEPGLRGDFVGAVTFDEWGIDGNRLCVLNLLDAIAQGAAVHNHVTVTELERDATGAVCGVRTLDLLTGSRGQARARVVVNATGAWAPLTAALGGVAPDAVAIRPGKGIHVYYDRRLANYAVTVQAVDGRSVFVLPWQNMTVIGTTDDDYYGDLDDVVATADEVRYLVEAVARVFPAIRDARAIGTWAGVRPTLFAWGKVEDALSREHRIVDHEALGAPGLYSMLGGKLASYRLFAAELVDLVAQRLGKEAHCRTATEPLPGAGPVPDVAALARRGGIDEVAAGRLVFRHGARATEVVARMVEHPHEARLVCHCELVTEAEVRFVVDQELARTAEDVARRTRLGLGACGGLRCAVRCGATVAEATGSSPLAAHEMARSLVHATARRRVPSLGPDQARAEALLRAAWRSELGEELP